jgi:hypothetical protein
MVQPCDPVGQRGDRRLVRDIEELNAEIRAAIRFSQIVRVKPCSDNLAAVFTDG